jgi:hypothetical protein
MNSTLLLLSPWIKVLDPIYAITKARSTVTNLVEGNFLQAGQDYLASVPGISVLGMAAKPIALTAAGLVSGPSAAPAVAAKVASYASSTIAPMLQQGAKIWTYPARYVVKIGSRVAIRSIGGLTQAAKGFAATQGMAMKAFATKTMIPAVAAAIKSGSAAAATIGSGIKAGLISIGPKGWIVLGTIALGTLLLSTSLARKQANDMSSSDLSQGPAMPQPAVVSPLMAAPSRFANHQVNPWGSRKV